MRETEESRQIGISLLHSGMAEIWGDVRAPDAVAFDRRLDELSATVCPADPRTKAQRRADALSALAARDAVRLRFAGLSGEETGCHGRGCRHPCAGRSRHG